MEIDIGRILTKRAQLSSARPAIIADQRRLTFSALEAAANRAANILVRLGVRAGDRVAVLQRNCAEYFVLYYAVAKIGAILCGINWRLAGPEIEFILGDAEPRLLIHSREFEAVALPDPIPEDVPVTIAWAARDLVLPPWQAAAARELYPAAQHLMLRGVGHVPMWDAPGRVVRTLLRGSAPVANTARLRRSS